MGGGNLNPKQVLRGLFYPSAQQSWHMTLFFFMKKRKNGKITVRLTNAVVKKITQESVTLVVED